MRANGAFFTGLLCLGLVLVAWCGTARALSPTAEAPPSLRICCYLGHHTETHLGPLHTPIVFANTVGIDELGTHAYTNRSVLSERNGLVYTCAGGLIDVGHVRNAADWAGHLLPIVRAELGTGSSQTIHHELGRVELRLPRRPVSTTLHEPLARAITQRVAYELAVWHELATLHSPGQYALFPEQFSAFSPEDLYSDLLGAELGVRAALSPKPYDDALAALLPTALQRLGALSASESESALDLLAARLWDPKAVVPEAALLLERRLPLVPSLEPTPAAVSGLGSCRGTSLVRQGVPESLGLERIANYYELAFHVGDDQRARFLGTPRGRGPLLSSEIPRAVQHAHRLLAPTASSSDSPASDLRLVPPERERWTRWRRTPLGEYQGVRFLPLTAFGGASLSGELSSTGSATWSGVGGGSLLGVQAETVGGDAFILRYTALWAGTELGLVHHLTGVQARAQFLCEHTVTRAWQPPVLAWFRDCKPNGWLGVGATILQAQHDGATGRSVLRPVELQLALNLLGNGFTPSFLQHRLVLTLGAGIDSISGLADVSAHVAPRGVATLSGLVRTQDTHWELAGHVGVRHIAVSSFLFHLPSSGRGGRPWRHPST